MLGWGQISILSPALALCEITVQETWVQLCCFHFHLPTHHSSRKPLASLAPLHAVTSEGALKMDIDEPGDNKAWELLFLFLILGPSPTLPLRVGKLQRNKETVVPNSTTSQQRQGRVWVSPSNLFFPGIGILKSFILT